MEGRCGRISECDHGYSGNRSRRRYHFQTEESWRGAHGAGGEIGHVHVEDDEHESCNCGNQGCLEQYASATGIVRLANRMLAATDKPLRTEKRGSDCKIRFRRCKKQATSWLWKLPRKSVNIWEPLWLLLPAWVDPEVYVYWRRRFQGW